MTTQLECPVCHRPMMSAAEFCGGSFTEADHPPHVAPVPGGSSTQQKSEPPAPTKEGQG